MSLVHPDILAVFNQQNLPPDVLSQLIFNEQQALNTRNADALDQRIDLPIQMQQVLDQTLLQSREHLAKLYHEYQLNKNAQPQKDTANLYFISGAPGCGKSYYAKMIEQKHQLFYLSADSVKGIFKHFFFAHLFHFMLTNPTVFDLDAQQLALIKRKDFAKNPFTVYSLSKPTKPNHVNVFDHPFLQFLATSYPVYFKYFQDPYIHRLTSGIVWDQLDQALAQRQSVVIETLGLKATQDALTIHKALDQKFNVHLVHVSAQTHLACQRALMRYLNDPNKRFISLSHTAFTHQHTINQFFELVSLLQGYDVDFRFLDNSQQTFETLLHQSTCKPLDRGRIKAIEDQLITIKAPKTQLWFLGENQTADLVCFYQNPQTHQVFVACIQRKNPPFANHFALPGGFVDTLVPKGSFFEPSETPMQAAVREFYEEAAPSIDPQQLRLDFVGTYGSMERDPRNSDHAWIRSFAYSTLLPPTDQAPTLYPEKSETLGAQWLSIEQILFNTPMAFDHKQIILDAFDKIKPTLPYPLTTMGIETSQRTLPNATKKPKH